MKKFYNINHVILKSSFYNEGFELLKSRLEEGYAVMICINHIEEKVRFYIESLYATRLKEYYGDRLVINGGVKDPNTTYELIQE